MGNTAVKGQRADKDVRYRVVRAHCAGTGETTDVECRPVDLECKTKPGWPPPLRPDPTAFIDDSGARGSAVECSLTVDFPTDHLVSPMGTREWQPEDVKAVMQALQHEESYSGVERFLFLGWVKFTATHMDGPEDRIVIITSYGRIYAIRTDAVGAMAMCGGGPGVDHSFHVATMTKMALKCIKGQANARLEVTFNPKPSFVALCTPEQGDQIVRAITVAKAVLGQGEDWHASVSSDREKLPTELPVPPDGGFYAAYLSHANAQGAMEPALVLTDRGEQTLLRLVLKDLLRQELDLSDWDPETYSTAAAALLYNTAFTTLKVNGRNKGSAMGNLAVALEKNPCLTSIDFKNLEMPYGEVAERSLPTPVHALWREGDPRFLLSVCVTGDPYRDFDPNQSKFEDSAHESEQKLAQHRGCTCSRQGPQDHPRRGPRLTEPQTTVPPLPRGV